MMLRFALMTWIILSAFLIGCKTVDLSSTVDLAKTSTMNIVQASQPLSPEQEYYLGRAVAARILAQYPLLDNWKMTEYVNMIGQTLVFFSEMPATYGGYHFAIIDTKEKNAFACPGGLILITKGMITSAKSEDELAAVIAHEIAHIVHRDGIASIQQSRITEAIVQAGTQTIAKYGEAELSKLVLLFENSINDVVKTIVTNGYSRSQEFAADESALLYLAKAGYEPSAFKNILNTIKQNASGGMLSTHPDTDDRIANITSKMPATAPNPIAYKARLDRFRAVIR